MIIHFLLTLASRFRKSNSWGPYRD